jgi:hypothetical protein
MFSPIDVERGARFRYAPEPGWHVCQRPCFRQDVSPSGGGICRRCKCRHGRELDRASAGDGQSVRVWPPGVDPDLSARTIAEEWTRLTFGNDPATVSTLAGMQVNSWRVYESYTGPLGAQTLTDILGSHYGPGVESSEHNGWGQWHRADRDGVGMDRTVATGTGYVGQYPPPLAKLYESLNPRLTSCCFSFITCPTHAC